MTPLACEGSTDATVGSAYREMRTAHDGPVTFAQDLTVCNAPPTPS